MNRDGRDRSQLKSLFCPCTREKQEKKNMNQRESDWECGIPGTRLETTKTQMKGEFRDETERKANKGKAGKTGRSMKTTQGGNFQGKCVCVSWRERLCCVERDGYSEDRETRQTWTEPNEQAGIRSPPFFSPPTERSNLCCLFALHLFSVCV